MDIALLDPKALRIKGKNSIIVVDPNTLTGKTEADAILTLGAEFSDKKIEGFRIIIKGPGEYEVGGIKILTIKSESGVVARADVDGVRVVIGSGQSLEKNQDKIDTCDVLVIKADSEFNNSFVASLEPKIVLIYGENKETTIKSLGKDGADKITKFSTTADKLPAELQVSLLES